MEQVPRIKDSSGASSTGARKVGYYTSTIVAYLFFSEANYINIIKFYENPDNAYTHPAYQVFTRTPSPLIISIEDESADGEPGYKLVDWFTSDQFVTLPDGELTPPTDKIYDDYKSNLKVFNEGDEEQIISFTDKIYLAGTTIEGPNSLDHYGIQLVTGNTLYVLLKI